jgi:anti-anti-sigma factor
MGGEYPADQALRNAIPTASFRIHFEDEDTAVLAVQGEIDMSTAGCLREQALAALAARRHVVLDLSRAMFFDSSGLRVLHELQEDALRRSRTAPVLRGVRPQLANLLRVTGMREIFTVEPGVRGSR